MFTRRSILRASANAALAAPFVHAGAFAQSSWPTRPVRTICMFPPGSGADILVRFFAKKLEGELKQSVVVENKVGAFGNVANEFVARSKPDGYTIYIAPANLLAIAPSMFKKINFDPVKDFEHITTIFRLPFVLTVAGDGPYKTVPDLVKALKEKGDKASYGSVSTVSLISAELFKAHFGLNTVEIPYKQSAQAMSDLLNKTIDFLYIDPAGSAGHIADGRMRALAVSTKDRVPALPNIPGSSEVGIMNSDVFSWWTVHTPKGAPKEVLDRLEQAFNKIAQDDDTKAFLTRAGSSPFPGNRALAEKLIVDGVKIWGDWVKLAKVKPLG